MKHHAYKLLLLAAAVIGNSFADNRVASYFMIRSQSEDSARELVGWANDFHINLADMDCMYTSLSFTPEYTRSFRPSQIAEALFGTDLRAICDCPTINISGSRVANRSIQDWLGDYFGLSTDYEGSFCIQPRIQNALLDINLYVGLDNICHGLFFKIHAPIVHTRWDLNFEETVTTPGQAGYIEGYFSQAFTPAQNLNRSFTDYICDGLVPTLVSDSALFGDQPEVTFTPLSHAKFGCGSLPTTKLSDIQMALGCNFWQHCDYNVGLSLRAVIPTGTRPNGEYLFEPIIGNGHHFEFGGGLNSYARVWSDDEGRMLSVYLDVNMTHLFKSRQIRVFDLKNSINSRYMLAELLGTPVLDLQAGAGLAVPNGQFQRVFAPVANLTALPVNVSAKLQTDLTLLFNYTHGGFTWDIGYNFWSRTCDRLTIACDNPFLNNNTWALKGDAAVYGFQLTPGSNVIALSATESDATIHSGTNNFTGPLNSDGGLSGVRPIANPGVNNAQLAFSGGFPLSDLSVGGIQTRTSLDPIYLSEDDLNIDGARNRGMSNKLFTHFAYNFLDSECWIPYIGGGVKVEFGNVKSSIDLNGCQPIIIERCSSCNRYAVSEWGVWLKGGVSFQ